MDRAHVVHAVLGEQFTGQFDAAQAVVKDIPFMGIAQPHGIGAEEHRGGHAAGPVKGKRVHAFQNAVFNGIEHLEVADHVFGGKGFEDQFTAAFLLDTVTPVSENLQTDTTGPGGLDAPGSTLGRRGADIKKSGSCHGCADSGRRGLFQETSSSGFFNFFRLVLLHSLFLL